MTRYHVNPSTGDYGICHAEKGKCPFGGTNGNQNHFDNEADAKRASEAVHRKPASKLSKTARLAMPRTSGEPYLRGDAMKEPTGTVQRYDELFKGYDADQLDKTTKEIAGELTAEWTAERDRLRDLATEKEQEQDSYVQDLNKRIDERNEHRSREAQALLDETKNIDSTEALSDWAAGKTMRPRDFVKPGRYLDSVGEHHPHVYDKMEITGIKEYTYRGKPRIAITAKDLKYGESEKFTFPAEMAGVEAFESNQQDVIDHPDPHLSQGDLRWDKKYQTLQRACMNARWNANDLDTQLKDLDKSVAVTAAEVERRHKSYQDLKRIMNTVSRMEAVSDEDAEAWLKSTGEWHSDYMDVLAAGDGKVLVMTHSDKYAYYSDDSRVMDNYRYEIVDEDGKKTPITQTNSTNWATYDTLEEGLRKTYDGPTIDWNDRKALKDEITHNAKPKRSGY